MILSCGVRISDREPPSLGYYLSFERKCHESRGYVYVGYLPPRNKNNYLTEKRTSKNKKEEKRKQKTISN
jgi:hypothetical protein